MHNTFPKLLIYISILLATTFYIQSSCAIDGELKEESLISQEAQKSCDLMTGIDVLDPMYGNGLHVPGAPLGEEQEKSLADNSSSENQRNSSFFPQLKTDEMTMMIFGHLDSDYVEISTLCILALTCKEGHRLMQDHQYWAVLKRVYFSHLPEEYITFLQQDREEGGLKLCGTIFRGLRADQIEETKQLHKVIVRLCIDPPKNGFIDFGRGILTMKQNNTISQGNKGVILRLREIGARIKQLADEDDLGVKNETAYTQYMRHDKIIDEVNEEIVRLNYRSYKVSYEKKVAKDNEAATRVGKVAFSNCFTRISPGAAVYMNDMFANNAVDVVELYLDGNRLRWVPDELFSFKKISFLGLANNYLGYLPTSIENVQDHLRCLLLGNTGEDGIVFREVPSSIYSLKKLEKLHLGRVGLEGLDTAKLYAELPLLKTLDIKP